MTYAEPRYTCSVSYRSVRSTDCAFAFVRLLPGDPILADKALAWGLVSEVVEPAALLPRAKAIARTIASRAPIAAETAKLNLKAAHTMPPEKAIEYERDLQTICFATEDAALAAGYRAPRHKPHQGRLDATQ